MLLADAVVESHDGPVGRAYRKAARACEAQLGAATAAASVWPPSRAPRMNPRSRWVPASLVAGGENRGKVISNLLAAVCDAADERRTRSAGSRRRTTATAARTSASSQAGSNDEVAEALAAGTANLAAGTAWLWAREEMAGTRRDR